jgi:hypothetical protein
MKYNTGVSTQFTIFLLIFLSFTSIHLILRIRKLHALQKLQLNQLEETHKLQLNQLEETHKLQLNQLEETLIGNEDIQIFQQEFESWNLVMNQQVNSKLSEISEFYGSDKGITSYENSRFPWNPHNYTNFYSKLFDNRRAFVKKVFECGIGTNDESKKSNMTKNGIPGASLRMWKEYFPNAIIYGADIDKNILFNEERIFTGYMDQTNPKSILDFWGSFRVSDFDFMIDDGLHCFEAGSTLFSNSIDQLSNTGTYIIEDVLSSDLKKYYDFFKKYHVNVEYILLNRKNKNLNDNILICIRKN